MNALNEAPKVGNRLRQETEELTRPLVEDSQEVEEIEIARLRIRKHLVLTSL